MVRRLFAREGGTGGPLSRLAGEGRGEGRSLRPSSGASRHLLLPRSRGRVRCRPPPSSLHAAPPPGRRSHFAGPGDALGILGPREVGGAPRRGHAVAHETEPQSTVEAVGSLPRTPLADRHLGARGRVAVDGCLLRDDPRAAADLSRRGYGRVEGGGRRHRGRRRGDRFIRQGLLGRPVGSPRPAQAADCHRL